MAPTSLPGQVTQTSPYGRDVELCGYPIKICEMLSQLDGPEYLERVAVNNVKNVKAAKKAIKKGFSKIKLRAKGFFVNRGSFKLSHKLGIDSAKSVAVG